MRPWVKLMTPWIKIKLIAVALVIFAGVICWFYVDSLQSQRDSLKAQRDRHQKEAAVATQHALGLQLELIANQTALVARETQRSTLSHEKEDVLNALASLYKKDSTAGDWADTPVPASVAHRLR